VKLSLVIGNEFRAREKTDARLRSLIEQVRVARDYGFDSIFAGQHYLSWPLQSLQPIPLLARLAAESGDMRIGTGIILLPLHQPVDMAEQLAMLDTICGGRFIFGVGLGYVEEEFAAFGLKRRDRVGRFEESIEIIKRLWTDDEVSFHGAHFTLDRVRPTATPLATPRPPIWIAANNHPAVRRAARIGDAWFANPHALIGTLEEQMGIYKAALPDPETPREMPVMREVFVGETRAEALAAARPGLEKRYRVYVAQGQDEAQPEGDRFDMPFEELAKDRFIIGDPDEVVAEFRRYEALGFNHLVAEIQPLDTEDATAMRFLHLLGREVLPRIR
jgi:alkanesulfonate monooxygenase SsuD/methylene tetrahydromethanopterin reductase-like flavin-dependent oxidoreductase (luciferase family)